MMNRKGCNTGKPLSPREREVLALLADGYSMRWIAYAILHRSPKTIETHRAHLMEKLGIWDVANLTKYAVQEGMSLAAPRRGREESWTCSREVEAVCPKEKRDLLTKGE